MKSVRELAVIIACATVLRGADVSKIYVLSKETAETITAYGLDGRRIEPTIRLGYCLYCVGLAVNSAGNIFIAKQTATQKVLSFAPDGTSQTIIFEPRDGPYGIAVDATGKF